MQFILNTRVLSAVLINFVTFLFAGTAYAQGVFNGGGGYAVECDDGKYYALDYVMPMTKSTTIAPALLQARNANEVLNLIQQQLARKIPTLAESLADFLRFNTNETDFSTRRLWAEGIHPLVKMGDEARLRLPGHCMDQNNQLNSFQVIIRREQKEAIIYNVDGENLRKLEDNGPLQVSFTYIHEWLRDYVEDAQTIMELNQILHSQAFFEMTPFEAEKVLIRRGITGPLSPVIEKFPEDRIALEWNGKLPLETPPGTYRLVVEVCSTEQRKFQGNAEYADDTYTYPYDCRVLGSSDTATVVDRWFWESPVPTAVRPFTFSIDQATFDSNAKGLMVPQLRLAIYENGKLANNFVVDLSTYRSEIRRRFVSRDTFNLNPYMGSESLDVELSVELRP